ncbi:DUF5319 family protein [uncultured Jatrophihabitans sp.]|uniref:DUF5319 family protein n=1 Tax=uncultured Jatrophihabitans sp. TaxID=1610747 RepID=UPI0035CAB321
MNLDDGPLDPFRGDPNDPAAALDDAADTYAAPPLTDEEREDVLADLTELQSFRAILAPQGVDGITVDCADCGEQHFFGWALMAANLQALLGEGRTHVHEPAYAPDPDAYVSWDYARGYNDAVQELSQRP